MHTHHAHTFANTHCIHARTASWTRRKCDSATQVSACGCANIENSLAHQRGRHSSTTTSEPNRMNKTSDGQPRAVMVVCSHMHIRDDDYDSGVCSRKCEDSIFDGKHDRGGLADRDRRVCWSIYLRHVCVCVCRTSPTSQHRQLPPILLRRLRWSNLNRFFLLARSLARPPHMLGGVCARMPSNGI